MSELIPECLRRLHDFGTTGEHRCRKCGVAFLDAAGPCQPAAGAESGGGPVRWVIRCLGNPVWTADPGMPAGLLLASFDPAGRDGRGTAAWTGDPARAMTFPTREAAFGEWQRTSPVRPVRPGGQPNKPLTAYSVVIEQAPC